MTLPEAVECFLELLGAEAKTGRGHGKVFARATEALLQTLRTLQQSSSSVGEVGGCAIAIRIRSAPCPCASILLTRCFLKRLCARPPPHRHLHRPSLNLQDWIALLDQQDDSSKLPELLRAAIVQPSRVGVRACEGPLQEQLGRGRKP